jgi:hypothetical protein
MVYKDSAGRFIMIDDPKFDPVIQFIIDQEKPLWRIWASQKTAGFPWIK